MPLRAKCTLIICTSGNICFVSFGMRMSRAGLAVSVLRLCIKLDDHVMTERMIDTKKKKKITCIIFWTYKFPVNEPTPHGFGIVFTMSSHTYQSWQSDKGMKKTSLLFPWFAFVSLAFRFHEINMQIGLSSWLQTN